MPWQLTVEHDRIQYAALPVTPPHKLKRFVYQHISLCLSHRTWHRLVETGCPRRFAGFSVTLGVRDSRAHCVIHDLGRRPLRWERLDLSSDHVGECLVFGDPEATVTARGVTIAFVDADGCKCSLEPDAFCCSTMLDQ